MDHFSFFSFGSPEPELSFGRHSRHHHPDNMNSSLGGKAPMENASLGVPASREVRQLLVH
jgi:hypothetical protein